MEKYAEEWSRLHASWIGIDSNLMFCDDVTQATSYPLCVEDYLISETSVNSQTPSDLLCGAAACLNKDLSTQSCAYTPFDTIDYLPPTATTSLDNTTICSLPETFASSGDPNISSYSYGLDLGIPPAYLPIVPIRLNIKGLVTTITNGAECTPIVNAEIVAWQIDPTKLTKYTTEAQRLHQLDVAAALEATRLGTPYSKTTTGGAITPTPQTEIEGPQGRSLRDVSSRARQHTSESGSYSFDTLMPPSYGPPRHIMFQISAPGYETLTTRMYFDKDWRLQQLTTLQGNDNIDAATGLDSLPLALGFTSDRNYSTEQFLNAPVNKDPRVAKLTFRPTAKQHLKSIVRGGLETEFNFVLRPTRSELVEATTARAADGSTATLGLLASDRDLSGGPPVDLNGIWADTQGALVRIETHGPSFIAREYPHPRTWGSVTGLLAGNVIRNVDFRRILTEANLEEAAKRRVPAEAEVHLSSTTWTAAGPSTGTIVTADPFATDVFTLPLSQTVSIQWAGGGLDSLWTKQADTSEAVRGYRYLKLHITRETGGLAGGALMLNEIEFFQGILSQDQHPVVKMTTPRFPVPQMVTCSSFLDQDHHCYKAFDGDRTSHSAWVTQGVGSRRTALSAAQWVVFDFGEGRGVSPTAMRLLCDVQEAEKNARGCPRTFTLSGSHDNTKYDLLYKQDLFDYNQEYGPTGLMSYFIYDTIKGRPNGQRCGSCSTGPQFTCALDAYDGTCDSRYCGQNALCSAEPSCPPGEYMHFGFKGHAQPFFQCKQCAAGRYGAIAGLRTPACSGLCAEGYYCPAGSVTDTAFPCGGAQFYCPAGSPRPIPAAAGRFTLSREDFIHSEAPSAEPSYQPSVEPSQSPSYDPSAGPSISPSRTPSALPSTSSPSGPSPAPTLVPTAKPTLTPTAKPTVTATNAPTLSPSINPSLSPSRTPTRSPSATPSLPSLPSPVPTRSPSCTPSTKPTAVPSILPSRTPTAVPTTAAPSLAPTITPTMAPEAPTVYPTIVPSVQPSAVRATHRVAEQLCPRGHYCTQGVVHPCPVGRYGNISGLQTSECSFECQAGVYCPEGSALPTICPLGHFCPDGKVAVACPAGTFGGTTGLKTRQCSGYCQSGHFCLIGSFTATSEKCPAGTFGDIAGLMNSTCAGLCAAGYFCPPGSVSSTQNECGDASVYCPEGSSLPTNVDLGFYTVGGDSERTRTAHSKAEVGYYSTEGVKWPCRAGSYGEVMGLSADTFLFETFPPSSAPTLTPSASPLRNPSLLPSALPSRMPSATPSAPTLTAFPTFKPSLSPSTAPSVQPTRVPSALPTTSNPSRVPTIAPSTRPSVLPTFLPTLSPSRAPSAMPTAPTRSPTISPTRSPSRAPTRAPTTATPTFSPNSGTRQPSRIPTRIPTFMPTRKPSAQPSIFQPSVLPTFALLWTRSPTSSPTTETELPYTDYTCSGLCSLGHYCPRNSSVQVPCPAGRYGNRRGLASKECTAPCPLGHFCPAGSVLPTPCPAGVFGNTTGLMDATCSAHCWSGGCSPTSNLCFEGYYCPVGSISGTQMQCGGADRYCPRGSAAPVFVSPGHYTIGGVAGTKDNFVMNSVDSSNRQLSEDRDSASYHTRVAQTICEEGHYCIGGIKRNCPPGVFGAAKGLMSPSCSGSCALGHYCPEGSVNATTYRCPAGRYGATTNLGDSSCSGRCKAGFHCGPASTYATQLECAVVKRTGVYKPGFGIPAGPLKIKSNQTADPTTLRSDVYLRTFNTTTFFLPNTNLTEVQITEADAVYCPEGSAQPLLVRRGYYSQGGNRTTRSSQKPCPMGSYCINGILSSCPAGRYGRAERLTSSTCTGICSKGHYCPAGSISSTQKPCPLGRYGSTEGLTTASCTGPCGKPLDCAAGSTSSTG